VEKVVNALSRWRSRFQGASCLDDPAAIEPNFSFLIFSSMGDMRQAVEPDLRREAEPQHRPHLVVTRDQQNLVRAASAAAVDSIQTLENTR